MRKMMLTAACLAALSVFSRPALAWVPAEPLAYVTQDVTDAEAEDYALLEEAYDAMGRRGYAGVDAFLPRLRAALDRAPASYPDMVTVGDEAIIRSSDLTTVILLSAMVGQDGKKISIRQAPNVYPEIALVLASEAVERGRLEEAIAYCDRGLAIQPGNALLVVEKVVALNGLSRFDEALTIVDAALAGDFIRVMPHKARLLRNRGFVLIELGRLDEAEEAYRASLEVEEDNPVALSQLDYIAGQRAGRPRGYSTVQSDVSQIDDPEE